VPVIDPNMRKDKNRPPFCPAKKLRCFICKHLKNGYSPEIIAVLAFRENERWKTNYETIYQWIYKNRKYLIPFLTRSHCKRRKRTSEKQKRGSKTPNRAMSSHVQQHN
jgi:IS30 family transposase